MEFSTCVYPKDIVKQHYSSMPSSYFNKVLKLLYLPVSY